MAFKRDKLTTSKIQYFFYWLFVGFVIVYCVLLFYPFIWAFICSFMEQGEFFMKLGQLFPSVDSFTLDNYKDALNIVVYTTDKTGLPLEWDIGSMIGNTIFITLARTAVGTLPPIISAYCCAKYKFWGNKFFFYYVVVFCSIPFYGGVASLFKLLNALQLYDTIFGVMFLSLSGVGGYLFYYSFFKGIDWGYAEAAFIDGANDFQVFWKIMFPQIIPLLFVFFVNGFISNWNDWMTNYMYLPSQPMIAYGIYSINTLATVRGEWTMLFAAIFLSLTVPLTLFLIFRDKILSTVYTGGLKG